MPLNYKKKGVRIAYTTNGQIDQVCDSRSPIYQTIGYIKHKKAPIAQKQPGPLNFYSKALKATGL